MTVKKIDDFKRFKDYGDCKNTLDIQLRLLKDAINNNTSSISTNSSSIASNALWSRDSTNAITYIANDYDHVAIGESATADWKLSVYDGADQDLARFASNNTADCRVIFECTDASGRPWYIGQAGGSSGNVPGTFFFQDKTSLTTVLHLHYNNYIGVGTPANASYIADFAGGIHSTGHTTSSDRQFKKDVQTIDPRQAYDALSNLRPVKFRWNDFYQKNLKRGKERGQRTEIGLIAQEVEAIWPELVQDWDQVYTDTDGFIKRSTFKGINYDRLSVLLISVVQEMAKKIKDQEKRIKLLESL